MVSDDELIELVDTVHQRRGRPFLTASELADTVDMSRQEVHRRLDMLHDTGEIRKYKAGRGVIWWTEESLRQREKSLSSCGGNK